MLDFQESSVLGRSQKPGEGSGGVFSLFGDDGDGLVVFVRVY